MHNHAIIIPFGVGVAVCLLLISILFWDRTLTVSVHNLVSLPLGLLALLGFLGEPLPYIAVCGLVLLFCGIVYVNTGFSFSEFLIPHRAAYILVAAALAWMSTEILEMVFGRSNPMLYLQNGVYAFRPLTDNICFASFPSEHGAVSAAASAAFSICIPRYRPTFFLLAALVTASRLLSEAAYLSDAAAGFLLGAVIAIVLEQMFARLGFPLRARSQLRT